ncbi:hypothetical protein P22_2997 [Propionispora sp. 2/2-37]|uniref:TIM barrel protein n=1 Tax=Propionispora sp. 2/2-37 TaxID=1677858 RepID=UPI0006BB752D|nr:TIM barrel protein [Propionispora sp. 2/2-37]CUH96885.1 hypothetical protein P22_2997 [Propionispora sp. 2/2-37]
MRYAVFGPAGNPEAFYQAGYKASIHMPKWLSDQKLSAYEYQCSRGANVREDTARMIGQQAMQYGIKLSIHAPYYISLATANQETAGNTVQHFLRSLRVASWMGADRVIFHIGGCGREKREVAFDRAKKAFAVVLNEVEREGLTGIYLAPETMGKQNQLGTLTEVLEFCKMSPWVIPAVDFGHLHAVSRGAYTRLEEFASVFEQVSAAVGAETASNLHIHFSKIEFTKAGEKRHWTFNDSFGPPHEPLLELCARRGYSPRIICESAGTQGIDSRIMQDLYFQYLQQPREG